MARKSARLRDLVNEGIGLTGIQAIEARLLVEQLEAGNGAPSDDEPSEASAG